jgi:hypothetical protein
MLPQRVEHLQLKDPQNHKVRVGNRAVNHSSSAGLIPIRGSQLPKVIGSHSSKEDPTPMPIRLSQRRRGKSHNSSPAHNSREASRVETDHSNKKGLISSKEAHLDLSSPDHPNKMRAKAPNQNNKKGIDDKGITRKGSPFIFLLFIELKLESF